MKIEEAPYAEWLEGLLRTIFERNPKSMALVATLEDDTTLTGYYMADAQDKAVFAHHIQSDAVLDTVLANADLIKEAIEGVGEDD